MSRSLRLTVDQTTNSRSFHITRGIRFNLDSRFLPSLEQTQTRKECLLGQAGLCTSRANFYTGVYLKPRVDQRALSNPQPCVPVFCFRCSSQSIHLILIQPSGFSFWHLVSPSMTLTLCFKNLLCTGDPQNLSEIICYRTWTIIPSSSEPGAWEGRRRNPPPCWATVWVFRQLWRFLSFPPQPSSQQPVS